MAVPAPPPQHEKAQEGNIVIPCNPVAAVRAVGAGPDNGEILGDPVDAHIEEATDEGAEDEGCSRKNVHPFYTCIKISKGQPKS